MEREQTTIRLPRVLHEKLQLEAVRLGLSFNALVLIVLSTERSRHQTE